MNRRNRPEAGPSLADLRALVMDMDGVLWRGGSPLPGVGDFFGFLRRRGVGLVLATNNASQTPQAYREKLAACGVDVRSEEILTSGLATAAYLQELGARGAKVYVIGEAGLKEALAASDLQVAGEDDTDAAFVVVGMDRGLNWNKLATATLNLRRGASFIGTNSDVTFPTERGLIHGNGAILAALTTASGVSPIVIGKPEPHLYRMAMRRLGTQPTETAALGDRLETDILGAVRAGMPSILVLSGVATFADLEKATPKPTWVFAGLTALRDAWEAAL